MIDLEALEWRIAENADKGIHVAPVVRELIAELKEVRNERDEMRRWAEEAAHAENKNAKDAEKERAAVVAWLLKGGSLYWEQVEDDGQVHEWHDLWVLAKDIERGEHRREEEK